ncbi:hypothetical protein B0I37DRAFT_353089 [Chaetomium sp. MPI-CAGE-AT-0009]|nr:hypothetical protein B0I37DRAFT_353089 [Chaetomium sp. MPI-CAGE-AT-0009]
MGTPAPIKNVEVGYRPGIFVLKDPGLLGQPGQMFRLEADSKTGQLTPSNEKAKQGPRAINGGAQPVGWISRKHYIEKITEACEKVTLAGQPALDPSGPEWAHETIDELFDNNTLLPLRVPDDDENAKYREFMEKHGPGKLWRRGAARGRLRRPRWRASRGMKKTRLLESADRWKGLTSFCNLLSSSFCSALSSSFCYLLLF